MTGVILLKEWIATLLLLSGLARNSLWSKPVDSGCTVSTNRTGDRALVSCRTEDALSLSVATSDGRLLPVEDIDAVLGDAMPTGSPEWSLSGRFVALEVALDEEPGVLLIEVRDKPVAIFVDRPLVPMQIAAAGPQWHPSGDWLVFRTSGAGGVLANEGVYALRLRDRAIYRLLATSVRSMALSGATMYLVSVTAEADGAGELLTFNVDDLIRKAVRVVPGGRTARARHEKK
jgi:hypothetical protein